MSTSPLRLTLPISAGESPASFVSRLARRNCAHSVRGFCLDMGLRFQAILDGDTGELAKLAGLGGIPVGAVLEWALVREDDGFRLRGERLSRAAVRRDRLRVCPECLQTDADQSSHSPKLACCGRTIWQVLPIRTCSIHNRELIEVAGRDRRRTSHDFAALVHPALANLVDLVGAARQRLPSSLENYLEARLIGVGGQAPWLDNLAFYIAADICELIGAVSQFGRRVNLHQLTDDDWRTAGAVGFDIASGGEAGILKFLSHLHESYGERQSSTQGPQAYFGRLYQGLALGRKDASYDVIRLLIRRHVIETMPVGPGDTIFGAPVEQRYLHSIHTASVETRAHPKRLRKILAAAGHLPPDHAAHSDHRVTFRAEAARELLAQVADAVPLLRVQKYLNCGRVQAHLLLKDGFIQPFVTPNGGDIGWYAFTKNELDRFLARLSQDAREVVERQENMADIPSAARRAMRSLSTVLRLILDRKLRFVGQLHGTNGYLSILVDLNEVRDAVRGREVDGLPISKTAEQMNTTPRVVKALVANRHLPAKTVINPVNRCPTLVIMRADMQEFQKEFVSLIELAKDRGQFPGPFKCKLKALGVEPAFDATLIRATFYRRADIAA